VGGVVLFHDVLTLTQFGGLLLSFAGMIAYSYIKSKQQKQQQIQATMPQQRTFA
jgi:hypothetical protein